MFEHRLKIVKFVHFPLALLLMSHFLTGIVGNTNAADSRVDLSFNVNVETTRFLPKNVRHVVPLENGKIVANGYFNNYNGIPVGSFVRLNDDGSLDQTFNNHIVDPGGLGADHVVTLPGGGFLLMGSFLLSNGIQITNGIVRLDENGFHDDTFQFSSNGRLDDLAADAYGRAYVLGVMEIEINKSLETRYMLRLNDDGSVDESFGPTPFFRRIAFQGRKIVAHSSNMWTQQETIHRLNEDGTPDSTFEIVSVGSEAVRSIAVQPDGKILTLSNSSLKRLGADGGFDPAFAQPSVPRLANSLFLSRSGTITISYRIFFSPASEFMRFHSDGTVDSSYTPWAYPFSHLGGHGVAPDGSVYAAEDTTLGGEYATAFVKSHPNGEVDSTFNMGMAGFQRIAPGKIRMVKVLESGKILIGGDFDVVNGRSRPNLARLNPDGTLDGSFLIPFGTENSEFSVVRDIYGAALLENRQLLVNGNFVYKTDNTERRNVVVLTENGGIDLSFSLTENIHDEFSRAGMSQNHTIIGQNGGFIVGNSATSNITTTPVPIGLTNSGDLDHSFNSTTFESGSLPMVFTLRRLADGNILIGGRFNVGDINNSVIKSYVKRLNRDGTVDAAYSSPETDGEFVNDIALLRTGKALIAREAFFEDLSRVYRLDANGNEDPSFHTGSGANGRINVVRPYTDGRILVGGQFDTYNDQPRSNFAILDANGSLDPLTVTTNAEVFSLDIDDQGRILLGGEFTLIEDGSQSFARSLLARLENVAEVSPALLDFEGDGKTDYSIFRPSSGEWHICKSSDGLPSRTRFGNSGDLLTPADYTGDGKTDLAFFRPSTGEWFILRSEDNSFYSFKFGASEDVPAPGDFNGDGHSNPAVFRPSSGKWYVLSPGGGTHITMFGTTGDLPVVSDYDGDGVDDIAVYRPSTSEWWINESVSGVRAYQFGIPGDIPVHGDYSGDGKTDVSIFRPESGMWFFIRSEDGIIISTPFGASGDIPVPGDYDGDGSSDFAVYRPSNSFWYVLTSTNGIDIKSFGDSGDQPVPAYYQR